MANSFVFICGWFLVCSIPLFLVWIGKGLDKSSPQVRHAVVTVLALTVVIYGIETGRLSI